MKNIIEIKEEVKIGEAILEAGDRIKILKEERIRSPKNFKETLSAYSDEYDRVVSIAEQLVDVGTNLLYVIDNQPRDGEAFADKQFRVLSVLADSLGTKISRM